MDLYRLKYVMTEQQFDDYLKRFGRQVRFFRLLKITNFIRKLEKNNMKRNKTREFYNI